MATLVLGVPLFTSGAQINAIRLCSSAAVQQAQQVNQKSEYVTLTCDHIPFALQ